MKFNEDRIKEILRKRGVAVTKPRIKIIECLIDDHHYHSVVEIADHLKDQKINNKTLYNNIDKLLESGIIESFSIKNKTKYSLNHEDMGAVHVVEKNGDVSHIHIKEEVFESIKDSYDGKIKRIRIFIEAE